MEMDSNKKSLKMGALSGLCTYVLYIIFVVTVGSLTHWQSFWNLDPVTETFQLQTNGTISWEIVTVVGLILASLVPVILMKYEKIKYALIYIGISLLTCVWLYGSTLGAYYMIGDMTGTSVHCPFGPIDGFYFFVFVFLLGSAIGTIVSFVFNFMRNKD